MTTRTPDGFILRNSTDAVEGPVLDGEPGAVCMTCGGYVHPPLRDRHRINCKAPESEPEPARQAVSPRFTVAWRKLDDALGATLVKITEEERRLRELRRFMPGPASAARPTEFLRQAVIQCEDDIAALKQDSTGIQAAMEFLKYAPPVD